MVFIIFTVANAQSKELAQSFAVAGSKLSLGNPKAESPLPRQCPSPKDTGWWQAFDYGWLYFTPSYQFIPVKQAVFAKWAEQRWEQGSLGFPIAEEQTITEGAVNFIVQKFQGGSIKINGNTGEAAIVSNLVRPAITEPINVRLPRITSINGNCVIIEAKGDDLYIGVDNEVTIIKPNDAAIDIINATFSPSGEANKYIVKTSAGAATVTIKVVQGNALPVQKIFTVKRVPNPTIFVAAISGDGLMSKVEVANVRELFARLSGFDYMVRFSIESFNLSINVNGAYTTYTSTGNNVTSDMTRLLNGVQSGQKIIFENVHVKGPDGVVRKVPGVVITVR